ncbi:uncharacterized protein LOC119084060 isoform X1 [Bradysia coprophila]|uniref:uncharacterized protein LOC119084060 isoform X1 n=1 Tax=Bradysia coprophila TaxID=38358 RepID=UPI00187D81F8|nr:uncharacterized protein LOC119084060 isoform X1 [Bradysia coprophila]
MKKVANIVFCVIWLISNVALSASVRENNITTSIVRPLRSNDRAYFDNELSKIDAHRQRYYDLESEIWRELRKSDNEAVVLRKIHEKHLAFYANQVEYGVDLSLFETGEKDLLNEVKFINDSVLSVTKKTLHKNERNFAKSESVELAGRHREFIRAMDAINNITKDNDFLLNIKKKGELQNCMSSNILTESTNQKLYEYYVDISAAQLKAYSLVQLSYMFLTVYNQNNSVMLAENLRMRFNERTILTQQRVIDLMDQSGRETWNCDQEPNEYRYKGVTNQVTRLMQGYVDNEVNLNPVNDCKKKCNDYTLTKNYQCYNGSLCDPAREDPFIKKCNGNVVNCQFIEGDMKICPSIVDRSRSYNYITLSSGMTLGKAGSCEAEEAEATSWTRWFVQCSNCFCYCDEESKDSDRYFSLQPVLSDTDRNMVITGVAIVKDRQTFYWQITQRKLISKGQVESPASNIRKPYKTIRTINVREDPSLKEGIDYHALSYENRSVNFDTLVAPHGSVLTGIKFKAEKGHLSLEIRATKFDFNSGTLQDVVRSEWISSPVTERTQIHLDNPDKSDRSLSKSILDITPNSYIDFQPTDIWKDAAQTTVPYIDVELVEPTHPTILSGAGLFYKGQPGYGGFIAPKIVTYDFAPHIKVQQN